MKRTLADITQKLFRKPIMAVLIPKDLNHPTYWIYEAPKHRLVNILREIELRESQDRILVMINTQGITPRDYIIEEGGNGLLIKFIIYSDNGFKLWAVIFFVTIYVLLKKN